MAKRKRKTKKLKIIIPFLIKSNICKYFKLSHNLGGRTCWGNTVQQVQSFVKLISDVAGSFSCTKLPPYTCQAKSFGRWMSPGAPRKERETRDNRLRVSGDCLGPWWDTQVWSEMISNGEWNGAEPPCWSWGQVLCGWACHLLKPFQSATKRSFWCVFFS